jgi:phosphatidate cytidylyltransferase
MLSRRLTSSFLFIPLFLFLLFHRSWWSDTAFAVLTMGIACLCLAELRRMARLIGLRAAFTPAFFAVLLLIAGISAGLSVAVIAAPIVVVFGAICLQLRRGPDRALESVALVIFAALYIGLPMSALCQLRYAGPHGCWLVTYLCLLSWLADTGAYAFGRKWGRHRLAPKVSPGKSWEGLAGALAVSLLGLLLIGAGHASLTHGRQVFFLDHLGFGQLVWLLAVTVILVLTGLAGDLLESLFKRQARVKDSCLGTDLTGHGGLLDAFDSLLINLPIGYLLAFLLPG